MSDDDQVDTGIKRKRVDDDNNEEEVDMNNSFELVYETPMAKIGYRGRKKIVLEIIPETPCLTPPPAWTTPSPRPRTCPMFTNISPLDASLQHDSQQVSFHLIIFSQKVLSSFFLMIFYTWTFKSVLLSILTSQILHFCHEVFYLDGHLILCLRCYSCL